MHLLAESSSGVPATAYLFMVLLLLVFPALFATAAEYLEKFITRNRDESDS